jgi:hypothetical protein
MALRIRGISNFNKLSEIILCMLVHDQQLFKKLKGTKTQQIIKNLCISRQWLLLKMKRRGSMSTTCECLSSSSYRKNSQWSVLIKIINNWLILFHPPRIPQILTVLYMEIILISLINIRIVVGDINKLRISMLSSLTRWEQLVVLKRVPFPIHQP